MSVTSKYNVSRSTSASIAWATALVGLLGGASAGIGQVAEESPFAPLAKVARPGTEPLHAPQAIPAKPALQAMPLTKEKAPELPAPTPSAWGTLAIPIDFPTVLRLAELANLDIAQAREVVDIARVNVQKAYLQFIPNINLGSQYAFHTGQIQKTEGNIITVNRDSLFVGGGPSLNVQLVDAIFAPLVAKQVAAASRAGMRRVSNDTYLAVAEAYFSILRSRRRLARIDETLDFLVSERPSENRGKGKGLLPLVRDFVEVGNKDAFRSDLERVVVEVLRRREERSGALQDFAVATAELARLLRLDPSVPLTPIEDFRAPLTLPGESWTDRPTDDLISFALSNRPEIAENQALIQAALARLHQAQYRPFLPSMVANYSWGDFGGGPDTNPPILVPSATKGKPPVLTNQAGFGRSGTIEHFEPRGDFDVALMWKLQNFGLGNRAEVREQQAVHRQSLLRNIQAQNLVMTQVIQANEQVKGYRERVAITRSALFDAAGALTGPVFRSLRLNFERIRSAEGRPLEVLDSIRGLNDLLDKYGDDITEYDRARFRLLMVLGVSTRDLYDAGFASPAPLGAEKATPSVPLPPGAVKPNP